MVKQFTTCLMICSIFLIFSRCDEEEATSPPKATFTVDKNAGYSNDTEFVFTVNQVNADAIALLPEGAENENVPGILISNFVNGKATVTYKYAHVGTFKPVVRTTNMTPEGESRSELSPEATITITSNKAEISTFEIGASNGKPIPSWAVSSTNTTIDQAAGTITITLPYNPYGKAGGKNAVIAKFSASPDAKVFVGNTEQTSEITANNFSNGPVTYRVVSQDGQVEKQYVVSLVQTPVSTDNTVKSAKGKIGDDEYAAVVDNTAKTITIILPPKTDADGNVDFTQTYDLSEVSFAFELNNQYALAKTDANAEFEQDQELNLSDNTDPSKVESFKVVAEDETAATYKIYAAVAPFLTLSTTDLIPGNVPSDAETTGFDIAFSALRGTALNSVDVMADFETPPGTTVTALVVNGVEYPSYTPGDVIPGVDFSEPVSFELVVNNPALGITYRVTYTAEVSYVN